jgi:hypothetical protein
MISNDLSNQQLSQLVGGGECYIHTHPKEILGFTERLELMEAAPVITVTGDYTAGARDEIIIVDTTLLSITITLPLAAKGREFQIVKGTEQNALYVAPIAPDTIIGSVMGVVVYSAFTSLHFKAVTGGWILL